MDKWIKRKQPRVFHHQSQMGAAPGTLTAHPDFVDIGTRVTLVSYDENELIEKEITDLSEIPNYLSKYPVTWVDVCGLGDLDKLAKIAQVFNLHALAMEDVVNIHQRPKVEAYGDIYFAVTQMPSIAEEVLYLEQISIFWSSNFVITFQQRQANCLVPLNNRIKTGGRRQRLLRAEYLAYAMLDTIIDSFFPILEFFGFKLDRIEEDAIINPSSQIIINVHEYKHDLLALRRAMWSQREAIRSLNEVGKFDSEMKFFLRDCEDHTIQLIDILESYRERTSGLMDIYLSSVSNKMNQIMKVLTMMATIFMPLTVITGIYGMNFDTSKSPWNMPELNWVYGYPFALGLMTVTVVVLLIFFWHKGWFRR